MNPRLEGTSLPPATQCDWSHGNGSVCEIIPQFYTSWSVPPGPSMTQNPQCEPMLRCWGNQRDTIGTCQRLSPRGDEVRRMAAVFRMQEASTEKEQHLSGGDLNQSRFQRKGQREAVESRCGMWHNANV